MLFASRVTSRPESSRPTAPTRRRRALERRGEGTQRHAADRDRLLIASYIASVIPPVLAGFGGFRAPPRSRAATGRSAPAG